MLVVINEIWDQGDPQKKAKVVWLTAANISDLADVSSYDLDFGQSGIEVGGIPMWQEKFVIKGHKRSHGALELVRRAAEGAMNRHWI